MTDHPHLTVNRHLVTLVHKQPFLDWLLSVDPNPATKITLAELRGDNEAFLIPDDVADGTADAIKWVEKNWRMFFEHILNGWFVGESLWPKKISLKMFLEWFEVDYQSMVWDLGNVPLGVEDWDQDEDDEEDEGTTYH
jgi:hypothetical protein